METALKGVIVLRDPSVIESDRLAKRFASHDPQRLVEYSELAVAEDQKEVLGRLTAWVEWMGRYPTSVNNKNTPPQREMRERDQELIDDMFHRAVESIMKGRAFPSEQ